MLLLNPQRLSMVFLTSMPNHHILSGVFECTLSDHYGIFTVLKYTMKPNMMSRNEKIIRDFKHFSLDLFLNDLSFLMNAVTTSLHNCSDIEQAWDLWKSSFTKCVEKHAPLKKF